LINLITVSLTKLKADSLQGKMVDTEIREHMEFIEAICRDYIHFTLTEQKFVNPANLMSHLTVQTNLNNYKEIMPNLKLTMILYPRVLTLFWQHPTLRNAVLYNNTIFKYLTTVKTALTKDGKNIIILNNPMVA
jgi:hypothetical protein